MKELFKTIGAVIAGLGLVALWIFSIILAIGAAIWNFSLMMDGNFTGLIFGGVVAIAVVQYRNHKLLKEMAGKQS